MCIRSALGNPDKGNHVRLADLGDFIEDFVSRWCITAEGRARWAEFAWECMLLAGEQPAAFPVEHPSQVGLHIRLAEHVGQHGVREGIAVAIQQHNSDNCAFRLAHNITVVLPFAEKPQLAQVRELLIAAGIPAQNNGQGGKKKKNKAEKVAVIFNKFVVQHPASGNVYELPAPHADTMQDWQVAKLGQVDPDRETIRVASMAGLVEAICSNEENAHDTGAGSSTQAEEDENAPPPLMELKLREEQARHIGELGAMLDDATTPVVILLVAPQCVGKTTICEYLRSRGLAQCSADTHMLADGKDFNANRLSACHSACQEDTVAALQVGQSVVVDNTNMQQAFRTIYSHIATAHGAQIVPYVLAQDLWLTCDEETRAATLSVLASRARRRAARTGRGGGVDEEVIERTIGYGVSETQGLGCSVQDWLSGFPPPKPYPGLPLGCVRERNALMFRSEAVNRSSLAALEDARLALHSGFTAGRLNCEIDRGIDEFHITLLSPRENGKDKHAFSADELLAADASLVPRGIGRVKTASGEWSLFLAFDWEWGAQFRAAKGLQPHDFHVTYVKKSGTMKRVWIIFLISFAHLHVRCTPMGRTCREAKELELIATHKLWNGPR